MALECFLLHFAVGTHFYEETHRIGTLKLFLDQATPYSSPMSHVAVLIYADLIHGKYTIFEGSVQMVLQRESPPCSCSNLLTKWVLSCWFFLIVLVGECFKLRKSSFI